MLGEGGSLESFWDTLSEDYVLVEPSSHKDLTQVPSPPQQDQPATGFPEYASAVTEKLGGVGDSTLSPATVAQKSGNKSKKQQQEDGNFKMLALRG